MIYSIEQHVTTTIAKHIALTRKDLNDFQKENHHFKTTMMIYTNVHVTNEKHVKIENVKSTS